MSNQKKFTYLADSDEVVEQISSAKANHVFKALKSGQGSAKFVIMTWNHRCNKTGTFTFRDTLELAKAYADQYCGYLADNQAQVSEANTYPVKVVYRLVNSEGVVKDITEQGGAKS